MRWLESQGVVVAGGPTFGPLLPGEGVNPVVQGGRVDLVCVFGIRGSTEGQVRQVGRPVRVEDSQQLARFMGYVCSKLAREVGRLTGWREKIFSRRYQAILISEEESAQVERLIYLLSHGAKENLVSRPQD